jgi:hypothetical protein
MSNGNVTKAPGTNGAFAGKTCCDEANFMPNRKTMAKINGRENILVINK